MPSNPAYSYIAAEINGVGGTETEVFQIKGYVYRQEAEEILILVNSERINQNLSPLEWEEDHYTVALQRAFEISEHFAHERPNGDLLSTLSKGFHGENIAMSSVLDNSPKDVVEAWMASEGHRNNILHPQFKTISIASVEIGETRYWSQVFSAWERVVSPPVLGLEELAIIA